MKNNIKQVFPYLLQAVQYLFNMFAFLSECDACKNPQELWTIYHKHRGNKNER